MTWDTRSETCEQCGQSYQATYRKGKLHSRLPCPCDPTEAAWRVKVADDRKREAEEKARAEQEAAEKAEAEKANAEQRAKDAALAVKCWQLSRQFCERSTSELLDTCYACPRFSR